jgi:hypothetical protein
MPKQVRAGKTYVYSGKGLFESIFADLRDGDIVQVVNPPGGRNSGYLRHVQRQDGYVTLCNIHFLTPHAN